MFEGILNQWLQNHFWHNDFPYCFLYFKKYRQMVGKPHFLEFYIAVNMGQLFIYGHKGMLGVHGVLHQLSEGGNVVILFLVVMLQGLGIAIDEFQQIMEYPEKGVEGLLRSYGNSYSWQCSSN